MSNQVSTDIDLGYRDVYNFIYGIRLQSTHLIAMMEYMMNNMHEFEIIDFSGLYIYLIDDYVNNIRAIRNNVDVDNKIDVEKFFKCFKGFDDIKIIETGCRQIQCYIGQLVWTTDVTFDEKYDQAPEMLTYADTKRVRERVRTIKNLFPNDLHTQLFSRFGYHWIRGVMY